MDLQWLDQDQQPDDFDQVRSTTPVSSPPAVSYFPTLLQSEPHDEFDFEDVQENHSENSPENSSENSLWKAFDSIRDETIHVRKALARAKFDLLAVIEATV